MLNTFTADTKSASGSVYEPNGDAIEWRWDMGYGGYSAKSPWNLPGYEIERFENISKPNNKLCKG